MNDTNPNHAARFIRETPQNHHRFASSLDSLNMGDLMTPGHFIGNNAHI